MRMMPAGYHLDVRKNFEEKVSYVARRVDGMTVDDQTGFLSVDCGLPSDTFKVMGKSEPCQLKDSVLPLIKRCKEAL